MFNDITGFFVVIVDVILGAEEANLGGVEGAVTTR